MTIEPEHIAKLKKAGASHRKMREKGNHLKGAHPHRHAGHNPPEAPQGPPGATDAKTQG